MKIKLVFLLFMISGLVIGQSAVGEIKLKSGETINMYSASNSEKKFKTISGLTVSEMGPLGFNKDKVYFFDQNGDFVNIKMKEVQSASLAETFKYLPLEVRRNEPRLMRVIARNDKYILAAFASNALDYFYIYDLEYNTVEKQILHTASKKKSSNAIKKVKEYFSDCSELIDKLELNFSKPYGKGFDTRYHLLFYMENKEAQNLINDINCSRS